MSSYGPVVITGASGMIGMPLARRCLADNVAVHLLTRCAKSPKLASLAGKAVIHHIDWNDTRSLRKTLRTIEPRTIFHLAGIRFAPPGPSLSDHLASAVGLTASLLEALDDTPDAGIVFASSGAVYGEETGALESHSVEPTSWLGATKAMAEQLLAVDARLRARPHVSLRLFTPYGPDDDPERLVVSIISSALAGSSLALTSGVQTRDYVYIDDVTDAFVRAARLRPDRPQIFNIGSGCARNVRTVAEFILRRLGRLELARFGARAQRPGEIGAMRAEITKAVDILGWSPRVSFAAGIDATIAALSVTRRYVADFHDLERITAQ